MIPHQVGLVITYDGTVQTTTEESISDTNSGSDNTYTVRDDDTLWAIAKHFYGSGAKYTIIYDANVDIIEETAKAHGKKDSDHGHWIWEGTILTIPLLPTTSSETKVAFTKSAEADQSLGEKIAKAATAFSYTDVASGESDSVSITICDIGKEWLGASKPKKGASFGAKLKLVNWNTEERTNNLDCGTFILDDLRFSGRPLSCVLNGVSVPAMDDFKSKKRTKTWENTTVCDIAIEIANSAGVSIYYEADTIAIVELEQNKQTDSAFLYALCEKYGLAMKVYNHKIVIFDIVSYEEKVSMLTIKEREMLSWSYQETVDGTYTGVEFSYTDPDTEETINLMIGNTGRMYAMNAQASSRFDAELQATAKVNAVNRNIDTMTVTIRANVNIIASQCVMIQDLESADGKYYVDKIKHNIGNGYTMKLTMHRVQTPIKVTAPAPSVSPSNIYIVRDDDTLWAIAKHFYGSGAKYTIIYDANVDIIEETARAHGKKDSDHGHWIWEGTKLIIPEV